jgi:hypothetical protein
MAQREVDAKTNEIPELLNQPSLMDAITARLTGTDAEFADTTWTDQGKGPCPYSSRRHC